MNSYFSEPSFEKWRSLVSENQAPLNKADETLLFKQQIRDQILDSASKFTSKLIHLAESLGIKTQYKEAVFTKNKAIIATGHQPIVYHRL